ncbi:MAG TPA: hypothetical protein VFQ91_19020 [Bryobacteraceae bacterium]|nr:hypothetical protein [Bryobacteraceae bacterium]
MNFSNFERAARTAVVIGLCGVVERITFAGIVLLMAPVWALLALVVPDIAVGCFVHTGRLFEASIRAAAEGATHGE